MDTVFESIYFRQPIIHYVCPPVCDNVFSSSSGPVIVLNPMDKLGSVTGIISGGRGNVFLRWSVYPGALCYSVYKAEDPNNPYGEYVIVAECIGNPEYEAPESGFYIVTAITPDGETPFSPPYELVKIPTACPSITANPVLDVEADEGDNVILGPFTVNEGAGLGEVQYEWFRDGDFYLNTTATTKSSLAIDNVSAEDEGAYTLRLFNDDPTCTLDSTPISLTVNVCPSFLPPEPSLVVNENVGDNVTLGPFNVDEGTYAGSVLYKWYKNSVLYSDTTGTTQASLSISNAQESDTGEYALHISVEGKDCDDVSSPIALAVTPATTCGAVPTDPKDIVWTPGTFYGCVSASITNAVGSFSLTFNDTGCGNDAHSIELFGQICNPGEPYQMTIAAPNTVGDGDPPAMGYAIIQLLIDVDNVDVGDVYTSIASGTPAQPLTVTFTVPSGTHNLRIYVVSQLHSPGETIIHGDLTVLPLLHP